MVNLSDFPVHSLGWCHTLMPVLFRSMLTCEVRNIYHREVPFLKRTLGSLI